MVPRPLCFRVAVYPNRCVFESMHLRIDHRNFLICSFEDSSYHVPRTDDPHGVSHAL
jgi:hypothetical protein